LQTPPRNYGRRAPAVALCLSPVAVLAASIIYGPADDTANVSFSHCGCWSGDAGDVSLHVKEWYFSSLGETGPTLYDGRMTLPDGSTLDLRDKPKPTFEKLREWFGFK
jgi:hypothetical protein